MLIKPKGSPFYIFRHYATFSEKKSKILSLFFKKSLLRSLRLRYSADFRRSRFVSFFFVRPKTSPSMYNFLVQTFFGLQGTQRSRVRVPALGRNFFEHLRKRTRLKGPLFQFVSALSDFFFEFFAFKMSPFSFLIFCNKLDFQSPFTILQSAF